MHLDPRDFGQQDVGGVEDLGRSHVREHQARDARSVHAQSGLQVDDLVRGSQYLLRDVPRLLCAFHHGWIAVERGLHRGGDRLHFVLDPQDVHVDVVGCRRSAHETVQQVRSVSQVLVHERGGLAAGEGRGLNPVPDHELSLDPAQLPDDVPDAAMDIVRGDALDGYASDVHRNHAEPSLHASGFLHDFQ